MIIEPTHFQAPAEQDIHVFRNGIRADDVEASLRQAARDLSYRLVVLHGGRMTNEDEVLTELDKSFKFHDPNDPGFQLTWNGAADYIMSMRWPPPLQSPDQSPRGYLVLYREPEHLIATDALSFATLLDLLGTRAESPEGRKVPLHVALGPMSFRHEYFATLLKVGRHFCHDCLQVDGVED